ncbi:MAG: hypothetical protein RIR70_366, partial [Pseudomonadota bacterium]
AAIEKAAGPQVTLIDTGAAVARQLTRVLHESALLSTADTSSTRFWTTGDKATAQRVMSALWGTPVEVAHAGDL